MDAEATLQKSATLDLMDADSTVMDSTPSNAGLQNDVADYDTASDEGVDDDELGPKTPKKPFDPRRCLFCKSYAVGFNESLEHMTKKHSFLIPNESKLIVDPEIFIEYLYLVVFGYFECLYCGSPRQTLQAAQQHMVGKGHCKIDIDKEDSEYRDFYQVEFGSTFDQARDLMTTVVHEREESVRLASGKVLARRTPGRGKADRVRILQTPQEPGQSASRHTSMDINEVPGEIPSTNTKRLAKREAALQMQLASLRATDRMGLMHLPTWKQRAVVMESKKQVEKARDQANKMLLQIQLKANKTLKG
ncbi:hypothetical protein JDV02_010707 [Purpureocillium takamizusanense]|uniref:ZN622/Rei1/Reh1 zinc finger C2H2-type domain-containing protein n=1 Tax=Purpureocillium takamizusanense TaxID=2060973 RepID=A0A9Q8VGV1_9HYPO|nr:uncharacterized protein JDV02_010707 [Purpureocillium takamizusanense]UNI24996.1 hypothetical protein JDV02_010707 [Purpureocillium takamizusanense]